MMEAEAAELAPAEPEAAAPPEAEEAAPLQPGGAASVQASPEGPLPPEEAAEEAPAGDGEEAAGMGEAPRAEGAGQGLAEEPEGAAGEAGIEAGEPEGGPAEAPGVAAASLVPQAPSMGSLLAGPLPTSAAFEEGEPPEPPPPPEGEQLARRISLSLWELERQPGSERLEPGGSPEEQEQEEEESKEAAAARCAEEQRRRAELAEQNRQLVLERGRLRHHNARLQSKLAEALNKAKGKERARPELEQHVSDKEQRYNRYLAMLQELRDQQQEEMAWYQQQMETLQRAYEKRQTVLKGQWKAYQVAKKEVAVYTMGQRLGGRQAAVQEVDQIQSREESKEKEMTEVHLENIKLKHRILKLEASLKAQEELAEGLHLIDFEQLKIENQTYNEKIEERNEELQKFRRKITNTVQILTQLKEKLQFVEAENQGQKVQLLAVEVLLGQKREVLTKMKQARDRLRIDNEKLHQKCGLLGDTLLLRDFEENVDVAEVLKQRLKARKCQHARFTLTCKGVKKKIRRIKSFLLL